MKIFAYYLPQFHSIPENDQWWGEGFTEWTHLKNAVSLYDGHNQPKEPLNDYYYNLLNHDTVKWQTDLAKEYGIDGFIYYHYYFKGKKLLEKPAENLLKWKDINHKFYFCWANHSWYKSDNGTRKLLLEQTYGDESDWKVHFEYLLPFFKDSRYEKIDNKPVMMIFFPRFKEKRKIIRCFDRWCKEAGFSGIYFIETALMMTPSKFLPNKTSLYELREPNHSKYICDNFLHKKKIVKYKDDNSNAELSVYDGNFFFNIMLKYFWRNKKIIHCLFFEWDNTPRHGMWGYVITPPDKEKIMKYLDCMKDDEMIIINAWNEWAEDMILEPTKENGYKYLEWIKEWKDNMIHRK